MEPLQAGDPRWLGPFWLLGRLGAGGMGQVYLGQAPKGPRVAVKVVHPGYAGEVSFRQRFGREIDAGYGARAPWVARMVSAEPNAQRPWLATEYIEGPTLEQAVAAHGPLPEQTVAVLAGRLADALAGLHSAGMVHRDLKPSNIVLAADGPYLIDFGIAQAVDATSITGTGTVLGPPGYMSPEQAQGEPAGTESDIFSLAAVLTFAATGHGPFGDTANAVAMLLRVAGDDPNIDELPDKLRTVLEPCFAKGPGARPSARDLAVIFAAAAGTGGWPPHGFGQRPAAAGTGLDAVAPDRPTPHEDPTTRIPLNGGDPAETPTVATPTTVLDPNRAPGRAAPARRTNRWLAISAAALVLVLAGVTVLVLRDNRVALPLVGPDLPTYTTVGQLNQAIDTGINAGRTARLGGHTTVTGQSQLTAEVDGVARLDGTEVSSRTSQRVRASNTPLIPVGTTTEVIQMPGHTWLRSVGPPDHPTDSRWTELSTVGVNGSSKPLGSSRAAQRAVLNPVAQFAALGDAASITRASTEPVGGAEAMRYELRLDLNKAIQRQPDTTARSSYQDMLNAGKSSLELSVWLDLKDHPVRILSTQSVSGAGTYVSDLTYSEWGQPVQLNPPPPDQVTHF